MMAVPRMSAAAEARADVPMPRPTSATPAHPFVKWAGGKRALVPVIMRNLPDGMAWGGGTMSLS